MLKRHGEGTAQLPSPVVLGQVTARHDGRGLVVDASSGGNFPKHLNLRPPTNGQRHLARPTCSLHSSGAIAALEACGAPVDELNGALGLDGGHRSVHVLHGQSSEVQLPYSTTALQVSPWCKSNEQQISTAFGTTSPRYIMQQALFTGALVPTEERSGKHEA